MLKIVGLSGGIACGKSTVAAIIRIQGYPVVDADLLARDVVAKGQPVLQHIVDHFGDQILTDNGELDRRELGRVIFGDEGARKKLESMTHPAIALAGQEKFIELTQIGHDLIFYEAALLVETGGYRSMSALVVVTARPEIQRQRLRARDIDLSDEEVEKRIASQMPLAEKEAVADYVVSNNTGRDELEAEVVDVLNQLQSRFDG